MKYTCREQNLGTCPPECVLHYDFDFFWKSVLDINDITYYILPIDCLLIAYRLPLMPICSAIMDMGPGPGPRAQTLRAPPAPAPQLLGLGPWARAHIHYG